MRGERLALRAGSVLIISIGEEMELGCLFTNWLAGLQQKCQWEYPVNCRALLSTVVW